MFEMLLGSLRICYEGSKSDAANIMSDFGVTPCVREYAPYGPMLSYHTHHKDVMVVISGNDPSSFRAIRPSPLGLDVSYLKGDANYLDPEISSNITPTSPWEMVHNKGSFFSPITISSPCWVIPREYSMSLMCFLDEADHMEWRLSQ